MATSVGELAINVLTNFATVTTEFGKMADGINRSAKNIEKTVEGMSSKFDGFVKLIGVGVAARWAQNLISDSIGAIASLSDLSKQTGATVEALSSIRNVARLSGTSLEEVGAGMGRLARASVDAMSGSGKAAEALGRLGLNARTFATEFKTTDQQLLVVAKRFAELADGPQKTALAMDLLGKSGAQLLPFLSELAERGIEGAKIQDQQSKAAKQLQDSWEELRISISDFGERIALNVIPVLQKMVDNFAQLTKIAGLAIGTFVAFKAIPAIFTAATVAVAAYREAVISAVLAEELLGIKPVKGLAGLVASLNKAQLAMLALKGAAAATLAGFLGWEIGSFLEQNFLKAKLAGIALVDGLLKGWESVKYFALVAWESIKFKWNEAVEAMKVSFGGFITLIGKGLSFIPGLEGMAQQAEAFGKSLTSSAGHAVSNYNARVRQLAEENIRARAQITATTDEIADFAIQANLAAKAAASVKPARTTDPPKPPDTAKLNEFLRIWEQAQKTLHESEVALQDVAKAASEQTTPAMRTLLDLQRSPDWKINPFKAQIEGALLAANANQKLTNSTKAALAADAEGIAHMLKLRDDYNKAIEESIRNAARLNEETIAQFANAAGESVRAIEQQIDTERLRNASIGLSRTAYIGLTIAQEESALASLRVMEGAQVEVQAAELRIAKLRELQGVVGRGDALEEAHQGWTRLFDDIADSAANFIEDFVTSGSKAFRNLWDNFKAWALRALAQVAAQRVVVQIAGSIGLGSVAQSALGNPLAALGPGGAGGFFDSLPSFGTALSNIAGGFSTFTTLLGEGAGIVSSFGSAIAGLGPSFLSVLGPIGAVAGVVGLVASLFKSKGGPKGGGFAATGIDLGIGELIANIDAERFFTPSDADATVREIVDSVATTYANVARSFGLTAGRAQFALGFDTDPKGTAQNRVSASASIGGREVFGVRDRDVGRDDAALQSQLALEAQRALLAALQASDFPAYLANVLNSVDVAAASQEQIQNIIATAQAVKVAVDTVSGLGDQFAALDPAHIQSLIGAFGGLDQFLQGFQFLDANFLTDAERLARSTDQLHAAFADLGQQVPANHKDFLDLLNGLNLADDAQRELYASLVRLAPAFAEVAGTAEQAAQAERALADARAAAIADAEAFIAENFYNEAEQQALRQAEWTQQIADAQRELGVTFPTTLQGFRDFVGALRDGDDAQRALYEQLIQLAPAVHGLATAATDTASSITQAAAEIVQAGVSIGDRLQETADATSTFLGGLEQLAGLSSGDLGSKLALQIGLIGEQMERSRATIAKYKDNPFTLDFAKAAQAQLNQLDGTNKKLTARLAAFVTLKAQYGSEIAEQLLALQEERAGMEKLFAGMPEALEAVEQIFGQRWQETVNGISGGTDGALSELERLRQGIADYLDSLRQSDLSPLKPGEKLAEAQRRFSEELAKAQSGDLDALADITKFADAYLRAGREVFGSGSPFTEIFENVETSLEGLSVAGPVASADATSLRRLEAALPTGTLASDASIEGVRDEVRDVREALAELAGVVETVVSNASDAAIRSSKQRPVPR